MIDRLRQHAPELVAALIGLFGVVGILVVAFVVMDEPATELRPAIDMATGGAPPGGTAAVPLLRSGVVADLPVRVGDVVRFRLRPRQDDVVRVRGYGISRRVRARRESTVAFRADRRGTFAVRLLRADVAIARVRVERR